MAHCSASAALAAELDLDGATIEGYSEDASVSRNGGEKGGRGGEGQGENWKDRIKQAKRAEKVAADRRMQRVALAQAQSDEPSSAPNNGGEGGEVGGAGG